jgi:hypothetical protein
VPRDRRRAVSPGAGAAPASKTLTHRTRRESRRLERVAASQARVSQNKSRGGVVASRTRATLAAAAPANGMNYGDWTARENHAFVKALGTSGAAFFQDDIVWTAAWKLCKWLEMEKAVGTREIHQIKCHVRDWFAVGERLETATSPANRRDIFTRKLAAAVEALEADDVWRHQRAQAASEKVDVAASADVAAYLEAAAAVATASDKAAARAERDALEEAAVNAYPDLFPVVEARRPCPHSRATSPLAEKPT